MSDYIQKVKSRLLKFSKINNDCIECTLSKRRGYPLIYFINKYVGAHRVNWIIHNGEVPAGMYVCHSCDNRSCIKLEHLFLGTPKENNQDMIKKGRGNQFGKNRKCIKYTDDIKNKCIYLRNSGLKPGKISEILKIPSRSLYRILKYGLQ